MPIPPPSNPLIDLMYSNTTQSAGDTVNREELAQIQKEQETRLIGTFMVQALFLALAILLYSEWEWSQFGEPYEAALFYGIFGFSLQASLYYVYRTMFEDSASHRRELKRMRNRQKNKMAMIKFEIEKKQMEALLENQMAQYQTSMNVAMADGRIDSSEQALLAQQLQKIGKNLAEEDSITAKMVTSSTSPPPISLQQNIDRDWGQR